MILQLNPTIDVKTPLGDCEAIFLIDSHINVNSIWVCRMPGGDVKHFYSDDIKIYDNPMNGKGWDIEDTAVPDIKLEHTPNVMAPMFQDQIKVEPVEGMPDDSACIYNGDDTYYEVSFKNGIIKKSKKAPKFEGTIEGFPKDPPGKWTLPPDHPDNGGALIGQDKEKWDKIHNDWIKYTDDSVFQIFLDFRYEAPKRFKLDTWVKVQNWYRSLADYKDTPFLDFLIKFYPAPNPKK